MVTAGMPVKHHASFAAKILIRSLIRQFGNGEITGWQAAILRATMRSPSLQRAIFERTDREWYHRFEQDRSDRTRLRGLLLALAESARVEELRDGSLHLLLNFLHLLRSEPPVPQLAERLRAAVRARMAYDPDPNWLYFHANLMNRPGEAVVAIAAHLRAVGLFDEVRWMDDRKIPFAFGKPLTMPAMAEMPLISVIMSARNAESTIEQVILSVLDQTWRNIELIVCDDASTDRTRAVVEEIARRDPRVMLIGLTRHGGMFVARNEAIRQTRGEIIAIQDADDVSHPQRYERMARPLLSGEALGVLADRAIWREEGGFEYGVWGFLEGHAATFVMHRSVIDKIGWFDCSFATSDTEYLDRFRRYFGSNAIKIDPTLAMVGLKGPKNVTSRPDLAIEFGYFAPPLIAYRMAARRWHETTPKENLYMPYPLVGERRFPLPPEQEVPAGPHSSVRLYPAETSPAQPQL